MEKKINAVKDIAASIGIANATALHARAEQVNGSFDFIVSRATATIDDLLKWTQGKYKKANRHVLPDGLICLKGGDLTAEIKPYKNKTRIFEIKTFFSEDFFETKKIVFVEV